MCVLARVCVWVGGGRMCSVQRGDSMREILFLVLLLNVMEASEASDCLSDSSLFINSGLTVDAFAEKALKMAGFGGF